MMMAQILGGPLGASGEGCMETDWRGLAAQPILQLPAKETSWN
jgi:hypothetical protein